MTYGYGTLKLTGRHGRFLNSTYDIVGVYLRGPGSIQYGGRPRDSMCILVATVKIIPTTSRVCHLLQLGVRSEESSWENDASKMCVYMPLKE